jgi:hypothetical protein
MRASWTLDGLGKVPFGELGTDLVSWRLHLFERGDCRLALAVVVLVGVSVR